MYLVCSFIPAANLASILFLDQKITLGGTSYWGLHDTRMMAECILDLIDKKGFPEGSCIEVFRQGIGHIWIFQVDLVRLGELFVSCPGMPYQIEESGLRQAL